jgi:hypothetical protein
MLQFIPPGVDDVSWFNCVYSTKAAVSILISPQSLVQFSIDAEADDEG